MTDWMPLFAAALKVYGVVAIRSAPRWGVTPAALAKYAARHRWEGPRPGVVILPGAPACFEQAVAVALAAAGGERILASGLTAAYLLGIVDRPPSVIELITPRDVRGWEGVVIRSRCATMLRSHATKARGLPCTTGARTLLDLAAALPLAQLRLLVIDARQRKGVTLTALAAAYANLPCAPGREKIARILAELDEEVCDSALELEFRGVCRRAEIVVHPRPFPYRCPDGIVIEIDVAVPSAWVAVECDGLSSRAERASLTKQHRRQNQAVAGGWTPMLVDWTVVTEHPERVVADLRALLAAAQPNRPLPVEAVDAVVDPRYRARRRPA